MKKIIGLTLIIGLIFLAIYFYQFSSFLEKQNECGMSNGPCNGKEVELKLNKVKVDEFLEIPNGKLGFINTENKLAPILFKINNKKEIEWARQLVTETENCEIPMYKMEVLRLEENEREVTIRIFNHSFSEPGEIYLDKNYNFKMMCLRPF